MQRLSHFVFGDVMFFFPTFEGPLHLLMVAGHNPIHVSKHLSLLAERTSQ